MLVERDYTSPEADTVLIPVGDGKFAIIDSEDADRIQPYHWHTRKHGCHWYACRKKGSGKNSFLVFMHRQIMHCLKGFVVHHINRDTLDNRKENLLVMTESQHRELHKFGC